MINTEAELLPTPTCLWNMAGAVEPLLYSSLKDIGVVTLCWRSLTWIKKINYPERNILDPGLRKEKHE